MTTLTVARRRTSVAHHDPLDLHRLARNAGDVRHPSGLFTRI